MTRRVKLSELLLGIEGLALLRGVITGSDEDAAARAADMGRILDDAASLSAATAFPERSVEEGYAGWSTTYDRGDNPLIALEETVLLPLLGGLPAGRALDAACGTGRVSAHLAEAGHSVVGLDMTPEMLGLARAKVPGAQFLLGRLEELPVDDAAFDLAVCCLALDHCTDIRAPIAELARAVRPGGRVILTDIHPTMIHFGRPSRLRRRRRRVGLRPRPPPPAWRLPARVRGERTDGRRAARAAAEPDLVRVAAGGVDARAGGVRAGVPRDPGGDRVVAGEGLGAQAVADDGRADRPRALGGSRDARIAGFDPARVVW